MQSRKNSFECRQPNKIFRFATSLFASLAIATTIQAASAAPTKISPTQETTSASVQVSQIKPIAQLKIDSSKYQTMGVSPWGLIPIIVVGGLVIFVPLFFGGLVVIGERDKFEGAETAFI